jgi:hypothetical protein
MSELASTFNTMLDQLEAMQREQEIQPGANPPRLDAAIVNWSVHEVISQQDTSLVAEIANLRRS